MSSEINDKAMGTAREELQESRMRIESLGFQLNALQKQVLLNYYLYTQIWTSFTTPNFGYFWNVASRIILLIS